MSVASGDPNDGPPEPAQQLFLDGGPLLGRDIWGRTLFSPNSCQPAAKPSQLQCETCSLSLT
jgi:hypothetical protein